MTTEERAGERVRRRALGMGIIVQNKAGYKVSEDELDVDSEGEIVG